MYRGPSLFPLALVIEFFFWDFATVTLLNLPDALFIRVRKNLMRISLIRIIFTLRSHDRIQCALNLDTFVPPTVYSTKMCFDFRGDHIYQFEVQRDNDLY